MPAKRGERKKGCYPKKAKKFMEEEILARAEELVKCKDSRGGGKKGKVEVSKKINSHVTRSAKAPNKKRIEPKTR